MTGVLSWGGIPFVRVLMGAAYRKTAGIRVSKSLIV